jgi:hypothetical protein
VRQKKLVDTLLRVVDNGDEFGCPQSSGATVPLPAFQWASLGAFRVG